MLRKSVRSAGFGLTVVAGLLSPAAIAQIFDPENPGPDAGWDYVVAPLTANCTQDYRLYLPQPPLVQPTAGWPVLVHLDLHSFVNTTDFLQLDGSASGPNSDTERLLVKALEHGIAVITARATPARDYDDLLWTTPQEQGGVLVPALCRNDPAPTHATLPGHGLFHPPGFETVDQCCSEGQPTGCDAPSGNLVKPYDLRAWPMAEKDAMMLVQHVRYEARQPNGEDARPLAVLDHRRIAVHSSSAGAAAMMWATFGPDRRGEEPLPVDEPAGVGSQYDESTRPDAAILVHGAVWWPIYMTNLGAPHFSKDGHADCPAGILANVSRADLEQTSALYYEDTALNTSLPAMLAYNQVNIIPPATTDCFTYGKTPVLPGECPPFSIACENFANKAHARWNGLAWKMVHPETTTLVIWDTEGIPPVTADELNCPGCPTIECPECIDIEKAIDIEALHGKMITWLQANLVNASPTVWSTITTAKPNNDDCQAPMTVGVALPGGSVPMLTGSGTLVPGSPMMLSVTGATPGSSAGLFIGYGNDVAPNGELNSKLKGRPCVPEYGGIRVPSLDNLVTMPNVQANGATSIQFNWPASSLPAAERYYQVWLYDPASSAIYATNALMSRAP